MDEYIANSIEELKQFIRELAVIPAPSNHEEKRAEYVRTWMEMHGFRGIYIDDALNVICPVNVTDDNDLYVFMAHTDVVFPDTDALPFREDENHFFCPGVGDDTARLAILLYAAKYFVDNNITPATGILIVANSCEEGLGNLKGSRKIVDTFGKRIKGLITIDNGLYDIVTRAVGSHRYRITVRTEGGHSYEAFGNKNAIAYLSSMINRLYSIDVPKKEGSKTTYNVGTINGGTSVNTIAQEASMLYEYRSDDIECLAIMQNEFRRVIDDYSRMKIEIEVTTLGERPCGVDFGAEYEKFLKPVKKAGREILGIDLPEKSGSTDCNYPLSKGIPAVCIGGCEAHGCHTREEYIDINTLAIGLKYVITVMSEYYKNTEGKNGF